MGTKAYMKYDYTLIRSKRKTLSLEILPSLEAVVRAPMACSDIEINNFVEKHEKWLDNHMDIQKNRKYLKELTAEEITELKKQAQDFLPERVEHYSKIMGLYPAGIKITSAQKRLGSCNYKNGLCFSYRLMQYPKDVIDYVVVHELAHIKHKNHSKDFYNLVSKYIPNYKDKIFVIKNM